MKRKLLATILAFAMIVSTAACGSKAPAPADSQSAASSSSEAPSESESAAPEAEAYTGPDWAAIDAMDYDSASDAIYEYNLGAFNEAYQNAKAEVTDLDKRMALMALAEAKLLETGVFQPVYGNGGAYAMSRVVPRSVCTVSWGLDEYKWNTVLVTNELIRSEDRTELISIWGGVGDGSGVVRCRKGLPG